MLTLQTRTAELAGTSYEIGYQLGKMTGQIPPLKATHTRGMDGFDAEKVNEAVALFDRWCPGLTEELRGFANALEVDPERIFFYGMTCLLPRCSQIAVLPSVSTDGKPLLARNYEFDNKAEDFCLVRTSVNGKYTHMGTSVLHFGRDDGFNEHGLAVTMGRLADKKLKRSDGDSPCNTYALWYVSCTILSGAFPALASRSLPATAKRTSSLVRTVMESSNSPLTCGVT